MGSDPRLPPSTFPRVDQGDGWPARPAWGLSRHGLEVGVRSHLVFWFCFDLEAFATSSSMADGDESSKSKGVEKDADKNLAGSETEHRQSS